MLLPTCLFYRNEQHLGAPLPLQEYTQCFFHILISTGVALHGVDAEKKTKTQARASPRMYISVKNCQKAIYRYRKTVKALCLGEKIEKKMGESGV